MANRKAGPARRKLSQAVVRTVISAYFSEQEKQEIAAAAENQGISMSSFVAAAALKDARRVNAAHTSDRRSSKE